MYATVKECVVDDHEDPIGDYHTNSLVDARLYEVEYVNGTMKKLTANVIAENIMSQMLKQTRQQFLNKVGFLTSVIYYFTSNYAR